MSPARIVGIGQTGVGKTELLKSIFRISEDDLSNFRDFKAQREEDFYRLKTGATESVTKDFFSFVIRNDEGFRVEFTDGPGLGENAGTKEKEYLQRWEQKIPGHDLLYWVLDGSSRDIAHFQRNMKRILDATGYRNRLVVVLNKVDQILLPLELEERGVIGWDLDFNRPSKALLRLINERVQDVVDKLTGYVEISHDQIVACSARRRWNHGEVLDKFLYFLPENVKIKVSRLREEKDHTELMSRRAREAVRTRVMPESISQDHGKALRIREQQTHRISSVLQAAGNRLKRPFGVIGVGQTGVGKTELLKSLFLLKQGDVADYLHFRAESEGRMEHLQSGSARSVTNEFRTFQVQTPEGFAFQFTDGPGLGESSGELAAAYFDTWAEEVAKNDLLYWVLDASSRDIAHIQLNIKRMLDRTGHKEKILFVLNKVDQILLPIEEEVAGVVGWDPITNTPSGRLLQTIEKRTADIIKKLSEYAGVRADQVVICSARRRWNTAEVLDRFLKATP